MKIKLTISLVILLVGSTILSLIIKDEWYCIIASAVSIVLSIFSIWIPTTKEIFFKADNWYDDGANSKLTISRSQHKLGKRISCELYEGNLSNGFEQVYATVSIHSGNITITTGKGGGFEGKALIIG